MFVCVEVLQPSQPNGSCRAWSVYLTSIVHILSTEMTTALLESVEGRD